MKELKYSAKDMLNFASFLRENFFNDGGPNYHPYNREKYKSGDTDHVFSTWLIHEKREL